MQRLSFARLSAEFAVHGRHAIILLYQPLSLETESVLRRDLTVGEVNFSARTPTRFGYGFDFYPGRVLVRHLPRRAAGARVRCGLSDSQRT